MESPICAYLLLNIHNSLVTVGSISLQEGQHTMEWGSLHVEWADTHRMRYMSNLAGSEADS